MTKYSLPYRNNSIDLLRLVAALQVLIVHGMKYCPGARIDWLADVLKFLPGVPLFFFLSGFLIAGSWKRNSNIVSFAARRIRRIYPGLFATTALSTLAFLIFIPGKIAGAPVEFLLWIVCQLTFLQSWNPEFIKSYGIGYSNVALWTIPIELTFYGIAPALLTIGQRIGNVVLAICFCSTISFLVFVFFDLIYLPATPSEVLVRKVFLVSPLAAGSWFWMFGLGMLAEHHKSSLIPLLSRNVGILTILWFASIVLSYFFELPPIVRASGNDLGLFNFVLTSALALSIAFRFANLSDQLLFKSDFSFGLYIYHIPVLNFILASGGKGPLVLVVLLAASLALASLSWFLIESPFIGRQGNLPMTVAPHA